MELELPSLSTGTPPSDGLLSAPISLPLVELRVVVSFHSTPSLRSSPFVPLLGNSNSIRKGLEQENLASSIFTNRCSGGTFFGSMASFLHRGVVSKLINSRRYPHPSSNSIHVGKGRSNQ